MLDTLFIKSQGFINTNNLPYKRYFISQNDFKHRLSILLGARGIGKSTTLAQYIAMNYQANEALYVSLDDVRLKYGIINIAEELVSMGGKLLCLDEIHKYENWAAELKNIYDFIPDLKVIATGSAAIQIHKQSHDLSRRMIVYNMFGMSFREFLELSLKQSLNTLTLESILDNHTQLAQEINSQVKPILKYFKDYLSFGYYPYYIQMPQDLFSITLNQQINATIESDLLSIYPKLSGVSIRKIKQLLGVIMQSVPFIPNITKLKEAIKIADDRTLKEYLYMLDSAGIITLLMADPSKLKNIDKPEKIYIANPNLMQTKEADIGSIRECFFVNQLGNYYAIQNKGNGIYASKNGDFICEDNYTFEIGGKNKDFSQIQNKQYSFLALDDLPIGYGNKIPLWLFGFLY
ncbi:3-dehydroquinate dehydratase [Helicobacter sp. 12S02634-8]|uniref:ATP-binding protein n=1 Tax=Helicobacter sp. 12S02634-8 TaxID=1476199 RepID=UPI000BA73128|nr:AAA family ATPase [Helicobacter sp. 12S02634-8]PAF46223.1 3-dehydroquinate dehydratase [Helicobacter sp. 12S02634-8]